MPTWPHRYWALLVFAAGVAVLSGTLLLRPQPLSQANAQENPVKVRTVTVTLLDVMPREVGLGTTRPARTWEAVAEVGGSVTWISESLEDGRFIAVGDEVLRLDGSPYELAITEATARFDASRAAELTTQQSIAISVRELALRQEEFRRVEELVDRGVSPRASLDAAERQVLQGEAALQDLRNALSIGVADREVLRIRKQIAELDLERTRFVVPFDVRITNVGAQLGQYASRGQRLLSADGTDAVEVQAQFSLSRLRHLGASLRSAIDTVAAVSGSSDLHAIVRLKAGTHVVEWPGRIDRVSGSVDERTQSVGIVVVVDTPYERARPFDRPALARDTFVEVEICGPVQHDRIAIPANSLRENDEVYVVDNENRLDARSVKIAYVQHDLAVIDSGLAIGDRVIISDMPAPIQRLLLDPVEDRKAKKEIEAAARP